MMRMPRSWTLFTDDQRVKVQRPPDGKSNVENPPRSRIGRLLRSGRLGDLEVQEFGHPKERCIVNPIEIGHAVGLPARERPKKTFFVGHGIRISSIGPRIFPAALTSLP